MNILKILINLISRLSVSIFVSFLSSQPVNRPLAWCSRVTDGASFQSQGLPTVWSSKLRSKATEQPQLEPANKLQSRCPSHPADLRTLTAQRCTVLCTKRLNTNKCRQNRWFTLVYSTTSFIQAQNEDFYVEIHTSMWMTRLRGSMTKLFEMYNHLNSREWFTLNPDVFLSFLVESHGLGLREADSHLYSFTLSCFSAAGHGLKTPTEPHHL